MECCKFTLYMPSYMKVSRRYVVWFYLKKIKVKRESDKIKCGYADLGSILSNVHKKSSCAIIFS